MAVRANSTSVSVERKCCHTVRYRCHVRHVRPDKTVADAHGEVLPFASCVAYNRLFLLLLFLFLLPLRLFLIYRYFPVPAFLSTLSNIRTSLCNGRHGTLLRPAIYRTLRIFLSYRMDVSYWTRATRIYCFARIDVDSKSTPDADAHVHFVALTDKITLNEILL